MFTEATLQHKSFHLPLEVTTNKSRSQACVRVGEGSMTQGTVCVALSQSCLAFITGNRLEGFFFTLD